MPWRRCRRARRLPRVAASRLVLKRAATPSAAAELVSPDQQHQLTQLLQLKQRLAQSMRQRLGFAAQQFLHQHSKLQLLHPARRLQQQQQRLDELQIRLQQSVLHKLQQSQQQLQLRERQLQLQQVKQQVQQLHKWQQRQTELAQQLQQTEQQLTPLATELTALRQHYKQLQEHITDKTQLLRQQQLIMQLAEHRNRLQPDEPCPLCGATEHPAISSYQQLNSSETEQQLAQKQAELQQTQLKGESLSKQQTTLQTQQQQLQQQVRQLTPGAQALDAAKLSALEPALSGRFNRAWFCPQDAQTDSHSFLQHSQTVLQQRGVSFCQLAAAECDANQLSRAKANCDLLLDCRGLGAKADWPQLRPVRGEVLRLRCSEISLNRPVRFYHPRYSLYVAPKAAQQFVVGATELESASEQGCTVRSALELLSALYALHPGFAEAEILALSASARPTLPSPVPQIQQQDGVIALNGLSRHGYLLGPVFARQTAELAQQLLCH